MATRSAIIAKLPDGTYRGIYCHSDGYPEHVGRILSTHYKSDVRVEALLNLGDLSALYKMIAPSEQGIDRRTGQPTSRHSFDDPQAKVTIAYGRDRGEQGTEAKIGRTVDEVARCIDHAYCYLFENGTWQVRAKYNDCTFRPVAEALAAREEVRS